jgi:flagellar basal-body rod protein FlgC
MTIPPLNRAPAALPNPPKLEVPRAMFSALAIASSGLSAQRVRMDVIAQNLANAETTKTPEGGPYQRRTVSLEPVLPQTLAPTSLVVPNTPIAGMPAPALNPPAFPSTPIEMTNDVGGVRVAGVGVDTSEGPMVYNPGSPDADANGYVRMPNVNMTDELMDLMNARRVYEANATVFQVARAMLHKAIDI